MTKLGAFIESITEDFRAKAALTAAGLMMVLMTASPAEAQQGFTQQKAPVSDIYQAEAINERVNDQLEDMKTFSDALNHSFSYGSMNISGLQKARNIAMAFEFSLRQKVNPDQAEFDSYFLTVDQNTQFTEGLDSLVRAVNEKKKTLLQGSMILDQIMKAYAQGREDDALWATGQLSQLADGIEDKLYNDISFDEDDRIDVAIDRPRIDVAIERRKIDVVIDRKRIDVVIDRGPSPMGSNL